MNDLTWEEKLLAIMALDNSTSSGVHLALAVRGYAKPETRWHLYLANLHMADARVSGSIASWGSSPQAAVEEAFAEMTKANPKQAVQRRVAGVESYHQWNGFMWIEVERPT